MRKRIQSVNGFVLKKKFVYSNPAFSNPWCKLLHKRIVTSFKVFKMERNLNAEVPTGIPFTIKIMEI
ncbi:unnamed protein product [Acanthoscelides obtectus]|uniref:Uncharacterized protein n=1 Tax=Acanthoscelides obtectus TaxID=200917 RepID=A0A9P0KDK9_ACAOB|nr:unnamed protein product [Acanthoscelides obtectus]CAK1656438.1 hypothetical protein AOBTE_LOCUS19711 [Acanthoscelides obtectus]